MSDTPETDAEQFAVNPHGLDGGQVVVAVDICRKLERERDEARDWVFRLRKQRAIARNFGEQMEHESDHWKRECLEQCKLLAMSGDREEKLVRERNEAREAFAVATSNCVDAQQRLREMEDQRDFAMSEMERLKQ